MFHWILWCKAPRNSKFKVFVWYGDVRASLDWSYVCCDTHIVPNVLKFIKLLRGHNYEKNIRNIVLAEIMCVETFCVRRVQTCSRKETVTL